MQSPYKFEDVLNKDNELFFTNVGYSMYPLINEREDILHIVKTDDFKDVWENKYKVFRDKERTSCDECKKCDAWDYCLGGSFHTFDFDSNTQTKCVYKMLKK